MSGKGDTYRKVEYQKYRNNYDKIFGRKNASSKKEGLREFIGLQHSESYRPAERQNAYFQEGSMRYAQYSIQYHAPTENHR